MDGNAQIFPAWFDPRLPSDEQCVLGPVLDAGAREHPDRSFAKFEGGPHWTWAETRYVVRQTAQALQSLGVKKGDAVLVWLPNGPAIIRAWFGTNYAGAVYAPVNISYRGALLEHVIRNSGARVMIAHAALLERLKGIDLSKLERVVCVGSGAPVDLPDAGDEGGSHAVHNERSPTR